MQGRFKTSPPEFNVEEFERSHAVIVVGETNPAESTKVGEQLIQAKFANPAPQASDLNFDKLCYCDESVE